MNELTLHLASAKDASLIFGIRNLPESIKFSGTGQPVTENEHFVWFENLLKDKGRRLWILNDGIDDIGFVRVDLLDEAVGQIGRVSIGIKRESRGHNYASQALGLLTLQLKDMRDFYVERLRAFVHFDNIASVKTFRKAGYAEVNTENPFVTFEILLSNES